MQSKDIDLLRHTYSERKKMLDEYTSKKKLCAKKSDLYNTLKNAPDIRKFEKIRSYVTNETTLLGFVIKENGTYDRISDSPNIRRFLKLEDEIISLENEIRVLHNQLIVNKCLFSINIPAMKIDNCNHELCTMTGIFSKSPMSFSKKEVINYETQETEFLYDVGFMPGDFFAYHCLDCDLEKHVAVPIESVVEFESTHKIIYGFRYDPRLLQQRYYELLIDYSFNEAYEILKEEIERGANFEYLKQTIATRKKEKLI